MASLSVTGSWFEGVWSRLTWIPYTFVLDFGNVLASVCKSHKARKQDK